MTFSPQGTLQSPTSFGMSKSLPGHLLWSLRDSVKSLLALGLVGPEPGLLTPPTNANHIGLHQLLGLSLQSRAEMERE